MKKYEQGQLSVACRRRSMNLLTIASWTMIILFSLMLGCHATPQSKSREHVFVPVVSSLVKEDTDTDITDLILTTDRKIEKIVLSNNQKWMILETDDSNLQEISEPPSLSKRVNIELWNLDYDDPRPIAFSQDRTLLASASTHSAAFDKNSSRVFWLERKNNKKTINTHIGQTSTVDKIVRGAPAETESDSSHFYPEKISSIQDSILTTTFNKPLLYYPWEDSNSSIHDNDFTEENATEDMFTFSQSTYQFKSHSSKNMPQRPSLDKDIDVLYSSGTAPIDKEKEEEERTNEISNCDNNVQTDVRLTNQRKDSYALYQSKSFSSSFSEIAENPVINIVMTKPLESDSFLINTSNEGEIESQKAKRIKTPVEIKNAQSVRISLWAKWLICKTTKNHSDTLLIEDPIVTPSPKVVRTDSISTSSIVFQKQQEDVTLISNDNYQEPIQHTSANDVSNERIVETITSQEESSNIDRFSEDWVMVPLKDYSRVIRFPETIKMTFSSSTSEAENLGKIIDVLAVSDEEDLVATLVEEIVNESESKPRYKIVIWDLHVALSVNLSQARLPLRAIEVSQIIIPYRVTPDKCKFSPSGKLLAARIDPHYISVWQAISGRPLVELGEHKGVIEDFDFSPRETQLAVGTRGPIPQIIVWDIRKGTQVNAISDFPSHIKTINAITYSQNSQSVFFANDTGEIRRWNLRASRAPIH